MKVLLDLIKSSVITQWTITVIVLAIYFYLLIADKAVPSLVEILVTMVVSFYFGSKVGVYQGLHQAQHTKIME